MAALSETDAKQLSVSLAVPLSKRFMFHQQTLVAVGVSLPHRRSLLEGKRWMEHKVRIATSSRHYC
jgi:hypothetical protein